MAESVFALFRRWSAWAPCEHQRGPRPLNQLLPNGESW